MSKAEYKRLGDYIREVNVRNRELKVTNLLGVSISKEFMSSIANTIGTDMSTYKIVERGQFAYGPVTSRNGDKVSIALLDGYDGAIISQAYTVFEVIDHEQLLPEYLMMWFRRPEFDRYARFHSHGSAREIFDWEELCDVMLPVPSITRQREIVSEYETLTNRIRLNNQMIQNLEDTAQALYRKTFVDNIDKENLPDGWRMGTLGEVVEQTIGGDWGKEQPEGNYTHKVLCIRGADTSSLKICRNGQIPIRYILPKKLQNRKLLQGDVVVEISGGTPTQSTGRSAQMNRIADSYYGCDLICSNFCRVIRPIKPYEDFLYAAFTDLYRREIFFKYENSSNGIKNLNLDAVLSEELMSIPTTEKALEFTDKITVINKNVIFIGQEHDKLTELQSLLLAKMGQ